MDFKVKKLVIPADDPFKFDKLDRKDEVENLTLLLTNISSPIVLAVNSPWGTGKTTFAQMLQAELLSKNSISIYFNAWETDFAKDPLLAFLGEMNIALESHLQGEKEKILAWKKAKKAGTHILKKGIPALIKIGTAGIIDTGEIVEEETSKLLEGFSVDIIEEYTKNKEAIQCFKENVSEVLSTIDVNKNKLYIFVDELDRCRPSYAVELLERIKHLLDIEGLVFILSLDKNQLAHSVRSLYGAEFDAPGYLRRFIDIEYELRTPQLNKFIDYHFDTLGFDSFFSARTKYNAFQYDRKHLLNTIIFLAHNKELSLREVEQLLAKINLVILSTPQNIYMYPALLTFLLIVKEYYSDIYNNYIIDNSTPEEIIKCLYSLTKPEIRYKSFECALIEGFLIAAKMSINDGNLGDSIEVHERIIENKESPANARIYSEKVIQVANNPVEFGNEVILKNIIRRINLLERFIFNSSKS